MPTSPVSRLLAAGACSAAAMLAFAGPAAAADANPTVTNDGGTYTMKLHSRTTSEMYIPKGGQPTSEEPKTEPGVGDAFSFNEDLDQNGTKVGSDTGKCTVVGKTSGKCVVSVTFPNGTLSVEGNPTFSDESATSTFQVVGGTGSYAGAKGKAVVVNSSDTDSDITVTYTLGAGQVSQTPSGGAGTGAGSTAGTENAWLFGAGAAAVAAGAVLLTVAGRGARRSS